MEKIKTHCPECRKLYVVDREEMKANTSEFSCRECFARFSLVGLDWIEDVDEPQLINTLNNEKNCPKCLSVESTTNSECTKCGFLFKKDRQRASSKVKDLWISILEDYENKDLHQEFLQSSFDDQSLPFAAAKYQSILQADPNEDIAIDMREQVVSAAGLYFMNHTKNQVQSKKYNSFFSKSIAKSVVLSLYFMLGVTFALSLSL